MYGKPCHSYLNCPNVNNCVFNYNIVTFQRIFYYKQCALLVYHLLMLHEANKIIIVTDDKSLSPYCGGVERIQHNKICMVFQ